MMQRQTKQGGGRRIHCTGEGHCVRHQRRLGQHYPFGHPVGAGGVYNAIRGFRCRGCIRFGNIGFCPGSLQNPADLLRRQSCLRRKCPVQLVQRIRSTFQQDQHIRLTVLQNLLQLRLTNILVDWHCCVAAAYHSEKGHDERQGILPCKQDLSAALPG